MNSVEQFYHGKISEVIVLQDLALLKALKIINVLNI